MIAIRIVLNIRSDYEYTYTYKKDNFAAISKYLARYRFKNNYVGSYKTVWDTRGIMNIEKNFDNYHKRYT